MDERFISPAPSAPSSHDTALRVLVLGTVYAAATFFAVVFSPAIGVIPHGPSQDINRFADASR